MNLEQCQELINVPVETINGAMEYVKRLEEENKEYERREAMREKAKRKNSMDGTKRQDAVVWINQQLKEHERLMDTGGTTLKWIDFKVARELRNAICPKGTHAGIRQDTLAKRLRVCRKTIQRAVARLEAERIFYRKRLKQKSNPSRMARNDYIPGIWREEMAPEPAPEIPNVTPKWGTELTVMGDTPWDFESPPLIYDINNTLGIESVNRPVNSELAEVPRQEQATETSDGINSIPMEVNNTEPTKSTETPEPFGTPPAFDDYSLMAGERSAGNAEFADPMSEDNPLSAEPHTPEPFDTQAPQQIHSHAGSGNNTAKDAPIRGADDDLFGEPEDWEYLEEWDDWDDPNYVPGPQDSPYSWPGKASGYPPTHRRQTLVTDLRGFDWIEIPKDRVLH